MNFKDMLEKISQLSEATEKTKTGVKHTADAGGYGRKYDTDEEGDEKKAKEPAVKRGRGRPAKGSDDTGNVKKYDTKGVGDVFGGGKKPKKEVGTVSKKHTLKDWFEHIESQMLAEAEQVTMEPAKQSTQVIKQGTKTLGTVSNPALAATIKNAIGKGEMNLAGGQLGEDEEDYSAKKARAGKDIGKPGKNFAKIAKSAGKKYGSKEAGERVAGAILAKLRGAHESVEEAEIPSTSGVDTIGAGLGAGRSQTTLEGRVKADNKAEKAGKKVTKDIEYDEKVKDKIHGKKRGAEDAKAERAGKKVAKDIEYDEKKSKKKAVKEGMSHKLQAARLEGKAHGLKGHAYAGKNFDDMEESRAYHEGYKEGLDECYGQMPVQGLVGEGDMPAATVPGMATQAMPAMEDDMDEGNAFTAALARTPKGGTFKVGGKTFTDRTGYDSKIDEFAFEAWDRELSNLLTEGEEKIEEGMTVSISKGQQGAPDSVSISAQDQEAEKLLAFVKQAGLGLFGADAQHSDYGAPSGSSEINSPGGIEVVGDHDGMMGMLQKLSGIQKAGDAEDYADEEGHDESCNECGMAYESCGCDHGDKEMVDEVESEDQMEFEVAEANAPDSGEAEERDEEVSDATRDAALGAAASQNFADTDAPVNEEDDEDDDKSHFFHNPKVPADKQLKAPPKEIHVNEGDDEEEEVEDEEEEVELNEWANEAGKKGTDASFEEDIDFMMKVISGGLNKPKSTGQTTIPVIAGQEDRMKSHNTTDINESVDDWKKLAGIK